MINETYPPAINGDNYELKERSRSLSQLTTQFWDMRLHASAGTTVSRVSQAASHSLSNAVSQTEDLRNKFFKQIEDNCIEEAIDILRKCDPDFQETIAKETVEKFLKNKRYDRIFEFFSCTVNTKHTASTFIKQLLQDEKQKVEAFLQAPYGFIHFLSDKKNCYWQEVLNTEFIQKIYDNPEIISGLISFLGECLYKEEIDKIVHVIESYLPHLYRQKIMRDFLTIYLDKLDQHDSETKCNLLEYIYEHCKEERIASLLLEVIDHIPFDIVAKLCSGRLRSNIISFSQKVYDACIHKIERCIRANRLAEIERALKFSFSEQFVDYLLTRFQTNPAHAIVCKRFEQLTVLNQSKKLESIFIERHFFLQMAIYIEFHLKKESKVGADVLFPSQTNIRNVLHVDWEEKCVYIIANQEKSTLKACGTSKKVISAVRVCFNDFGMLQPVANGFLRIDRKGLQDDPEASYKIYSEDFSSTCKDLFFAEHFQNQRGFLKIRSSAFYTTWQTMGNCQLKPFTRINFIADRYKSLRSMMTSQEIGIAIDSKLQLAKDIIYAISAMHAEELIHGDIKLANILFSNVGNLWEAKLIDFGLTNHKDTYYEKHAGEYALGYYGSLDETAPELFGKRQFNGNHFQVEMFAVGIVLYCLRYGAHPKWTSLITEFYQLTVQKLSTRLSAEEMEKFHACLAVRQNEVYEAIQRMHTTEKAKSYINALEKFRVSRSFERNAFTNSEDQYDFLIHACLLCNPVERIQAQEALQYVKFLEEAAR